LLVGRVAFHPNTLAAKLDGRRRRVERMRAAKVAGLIYGRHSAEFGVLRNS
jgi:hypothetical protein